MRILLIQLRLSWITDKNWNPDNRNCKDTRTVQDNAKYSKSRIFNSDVDNKWCFNLTTKRDQDYLVRGTFLSGGLQRTPKGSVFNVSIDATVIGLANSSDDSKKVEEIFKATNDNVNFFLLEGQGVPYISELELRSVTSDYLNREPSSVLNLIDRVDAGNKGGNISSEGHSQWISKPVPGQGLKRSQFGPIINAFEILQVRTLIQETGQGEVDAIMDVKNELHGNNPDNEILTSWLGDPCLPISWPGLSCELVNGSPIITKMNLTSSNSGPVPPSMAKLIHLKELDISRNNFMGDITEIVTSLPNLTKLYFGCNPHLSFRLPANVNRSNLITDYGILSLREQAFLISSNKGKLVFRRKFDANGYPMTKSLTYLHTFSGRTVIHTDVKSSNILLDQSMCAKVADFGFSKYAPQEGDCGISLEVRGTAGYLDPE
ncbi:hypothetical protein ACH5RR_011614 [Cinchona calisaya]|uniref:Protein kinase domain-containing protein n=1 Tax=Cinchona calisaya TaxID=153742 RepID=A0ABD3A6Y5_9GENT